MRLPNPESSAAGPRRPLNCPCARADEDPMHCARPALRKTRRQPRDLARASAPRLRRKTELGSLVLARPRADAELADLAAGHAAWLHEKLARAGVAVLVPTPAQDPGAPGLAGIAALRELARAAGATGLLLPELRLQAGVLEVRLPLYEVEGGALLAAPRASAPLATLGSACEDTARQLFERLGVAGQRDAGGGSAGARRAGLLGTRAASPRGRRLRARLARSRGQALPDGDADPRGHRGAGQERRHPADRAGARARAHRRRPRRLDAARARARARRARGAASRSARPAGCGAGPARARRWARRPALARSGCSRSGPTTPSCSSSWAISRCCRATSRARAPRSRAAPSSTRPLRCPS